MHSRRHMNPRTFICHTFFAIYWHSIIQEDPMMKKLLPLAFVALCLVPTASQAHDGQIAAGVAGGLLGGMLLGGALAPRPYYAPAPVYVEPEPVYERRCYWSRGEAYWDDWSERWVRPRVRVCD